MLGVLVLAAFEICGVAQAMAVFHRRGALARVWLGLVMGLMEMMWFPALFAYAYDFTLPAQQMALGAAEALSVAALALPKRGRANLKVYKQPDAWFCALLVIPTAILAGYMEYTHTLREVDGALYGGQSTYGDLCMHLGFATGMVGQSFPPEYTILPGTMLGYPFLSDSLSATLLIFGTPLSAAFAVPGAMMTGLVYWGFVMYAWELTGKKAATALAFALLVFNGGLGFIRVLDRLGADSSALTNALTGFYQTPTNMPEYNLRWVNALCDLLIPQRTLRAGWMCVLPALYLLSTGIRTRKLSTFIALGVWAGAMPMIHTHSFLALGIISLGAMIDTIIRDRAYRLTALRNFAAYGLVACALSAYQLFQWTFPQTVDGGSLRILFNWVNNNGNGGLIDGYFWFWIKNVGPIFLFFPLAALSLQKKRVKALSLGALCLFVTAEFVLFQPNEYDNSKLFFVAFIAMLPPAAELLCAIYTRLQGVRGRAALAALFVFVSTASGAISIARECASEYQLFSESQARAAEYVKQNTPRDATFLTANNHNNAVAALTGRKIVCGSGLYLFFHGLDYSQRETDMARMLTNPRKYIHLYEQYGVDYVFISSYERQIFRLEDESGRIDDVAADMDAIVQMFPLVYEGGDWYDTISIYAVSPRAIADAQNIQRSYQ